MPNFLSGMEGSGVTTVCKEIMKMPGACGYGLTTHSIFEDGTKGIEYLRRYLMLSRCFVYWSKTWLH